MKRYAAHRIYISPSEQYKLHYIQLDERGMVQALMPLEEELYNTEFYNGTIIVSNREQLTIDELLSNGEAADLSREVHLFTIDRIDLTSAKLGADNSRSHCHIQRLR